MRIDIQLAWWAIAFMSIWNLFRIKRKKIVRIKIWSVVGITFIMLSILLIPALIYLFKSPWHSISYYAPDTVFLLKCLVGILAGNGFLFFLILFIIDRKNNLKNRADGKVSYL